MKKFVLACDQNRHRGPDRWCYGLLEYPLQEGGAATVLFQCHIDNWETEEQLAQRLYKEAKEQGQLYAILQTRPHPGAIGPTAILERLENIHAQRQPVP